MATQDELRALGVPPKIARRFSIYRKTDQLDAQGKPRWDRVKGPGENGMAMFDWPIEELGLDLIKRLTGPGIYYCRWWAKNKNGSNKASGKGPQWSFDAPPPEAEEEETSNGNGALPPIPGLDAATLGLISWLDARAEAAGERERVRSAAELTRQQAFYDAQRDRDQAFFTQLTKLEREKQKEIAAARTNSSNEQLEGVIRALTDKVDAIEKGEAEPPEGMHAVVKELAPVANRAVDVIARRLGQIPEKDGDEDGEYEDDDDDTDSGAESTEGGG